MPPEQKVPDGIVKQHAQLVEEVSAHNLAYYQEDAPVISDAEYDVLFKRLVALEDE